MTAARSLLLMVLTTLALGASTASAAVFCVLPDATCGLDTTYPADGFGVQQALDAAANHAGRDTVRLGAATYVNPAGFTYIKADPVDVVGAGRGSNGTVLDLGTGQNRAVLYLATTGTSARSSVTALGIALRSVPSGISNTGLSVSGAIDLADVGVAGDPGARGWGVLAQGDVTVAGSAIDLPAADAANTSLLAEGPLTISDTSLRGVADLVAEHGAVVHAHRLQVDVLGGFGLQLRAGTTTLDDSVIRLHDNAHAVYATAAADGDSTFVGKHLTIEGDGAGVIAGSSVSGHSATGVVSESVIRTTSYPVGRTAAAGATANMTASWNDYGVAPPANLDPVGGSGSLSDTHRLTVDPGFVDGAAGDYRLRADAPLVDAGDPGDATITGFESAGDARGKPRIVGGVRDIGAYEYQHAAPVVFAATEDRMTAGTPAAFDAQASDDDGDPLTYRWAFDDGTVVDGAVAGGHAVAQHAFATAGRHTAAVTVDDGTGQRTTLQVVKDVVAAPAPPPGGNTTNNPPGTNNPNRPGDPINNARPQAARFAGVTLGPRRVRATTGGRVALTATCPRAAQGRCTGTVTLAARLSRRTRTIGSARFTAQPGRSATLRIHLSAAARTALHRRSLGATATATARDARDLPVTTTRHITLTAPRHRTAAARAAAVQVSDVTNNESAKVAVADDGTGLFAWASGTNPVTVSTCRVLPGSDQCTDRHDLPLTGYRNLRYDSLAIGAFGSQVVISATGEGQSAIGGPAGDATAVWAFNDRGATYTYTNLAQGNEPTGTGLQSPYLEPLRTLVLPNVTLTVNVRRAGAAMRGVWLQQSFNGPGTATTKVKLFDAAPAADGSNVDAYVGQDSSGARVVVVRQDDGSIHWRSFSGSDSDMTTASNWTPDAVLSDPGGNDLQLLTGGGGTTTHARLAYLRDDVFGADAVRSFTGFGWQDAGASPRPRTSIYPAYGMAPNGTLAAVFSPRDHEGDVSLSTDGGATWSAPARFTCEAGILPLVAVDDAGDGWVRWLADDLTIRAARITDRPGPCAGDDDGGGGSIPINNPPAGGGRTTPPATTPAPAPTPGAPARLTFTLRAPARVRLPGNAKLALAATCSGANGRCVGQLEATAMLTRRSHGRRVRAATVIGRVVRFTVASGARTTVHVRLTPRGVAAVRAAGRAGLRVTIRSLVRDSADGRGEVDTRQTIRVTAAARRR